MKSASLELVSYYWNLGYSTSEAMDLAVKAQKKARNINKSKSSVKLFSSIIPMLTLAAMTEGDALMERAEEFIPTFISSEPTWGGFTEAIANLWTMYKNFMRFVFAVMSGQIFWYTIANLIRSAILFCVPVFIILTIWNAAKAGSGDKKAKENILKIPLTFGLLVLLGNMLVFLFQWW
ncbi:hypothetical protein [Clostridium sp.]|uniref:hypothetical protein n=1 Tax=Clostridium sp. TaxID=1506 RepID=UPI001B7781B7|nr:hypothetical protein [Clostridium sp.]MBP3915698.1 hypothetical protein [Clostridium sp.]